LLRDLLGEHAAHCESEFLAAVLGVKRPASPLGERVTRILPELALAARAGEREEALTRIARLVGLGPGLTPAGDDFIIGWLAGLALGAGTPAGLEFLHAMCAGVAPLRHQTTVVSRQHLEDSCALMFSERLSDVCVAIAAGAAQAMLAERVAGQLGVGATSGADAAAGLLFALFDCESIYRRCESMPINLGDCDAHIA
jgi:hypothetical protein